MKRIIFSMVCVSLMLGGCAAKKDAPGGKNDLLIQAAQSGNLQAVQSLLADGADINAKDSHSETALMKAAQGGHSQIVKLLLEKNTDAANIDARNDVGASVLMFAAYSGNIETIKLLLDVSADVNTAGGEALLGVVSEKWDRLETAEIAKVFLERNVDVNFKSNLGVTVLIRAAVSGRADIVKLILEKKPDLTIRTDGGTTALAAAKRVKRPDIVKLLEDAGAKE